MDFYQIIKYCLFIFIVVHSVLQRVISQYRKFYTDNIFVSSAYCWPLQPSQPRLSVKQKTVFKLYNYHNPLNTVELFTLLMDYSSVLFVPCVDTHKNNNFNPAATRFIADTVSIHADDNNNNYYYYYELSSRHFLCVPNSRFNIYYLAALFY